MTTSEKFSAHKLVGGKEGIYTSSDIGHHRCDRRGVISVCTPAHMARITRCPWITLCCDQMDDLSPSLRLTQASIFKLWCIEYRTWKQLIEYLKLFYICQSFKNAVVVLMANMIFDRVFAKWFYKWNCFCFIVSDQQYVRHKTTIWTTY